MVERGKIGLRPTPPGPISDLFKALNDARLNRDWSSRRLSRETGQCHSTLFTQLQGPRVPPRGVVEVVAEAVGADVEGLLKLWEAAKQQEEGLGGPMDASAALELTQQQARYRADQIITQAQAEADQLLRTAIAEVEALIATAKADAHRLRTAAEEAAAWALNDSETAWPERREGAEDDQHPSVPNPRPPTRGGLPRPAPPPKPQAGRYGQQPEQQPPP